jgi:hypothetical protein
MILRSSLALLLAASGLACHAQESNVTPYRPSVSNPAQLPVPGQLELELGGLAMQASDGRRNSAPYLLKLAFDREWGVLLGGDAYVSAPAANGGRARGVGDASLVLKRAFSVDQATVYGLELSASLPTASTAIGSGKSDVTVNAIASKDLGNWHIDANLNGTRLGAPDPGASHLLMGASAAFSHPLDERWSATVEWSGTRNAGSASTAQLLAALSYAPNKNLTLDVGFARGLNPASPDWSLFTGMVVPLARLW